MNLNCGKGNAIMKATWILILIVSSALRFETVKAENVTLFLQFTNNQVVRSATITLRSNEVAQLKYAYVDVGISLVVSDGTRLFNLPLWGPFPIVGVPAFAGPASIYVESAPGVLTGTNTNSGICTFFITRLGDQALGNFVPSNAVVIPNDSGGPVQIILESSSDLVTWTAATPGSYGAETDKRFFRVRAQR